MTCGSVPRTDANIAGAALTRLSSLNHAGPSSGVSSSAELTANLLLSSVGTRLAHSRQVAHQAALASRLLEEPWRTVLVGAAWLHDIGYNDELATTGFHPLDGARWLRLRPRSWPMELCRLVAWHTEPLAEGRMRGLDMALGTEFAPPPPLPRAALTWADLTSSPEGKCWPAESRVAEILRRHPLGSVVHRATIASLPELRQAVGHIERALAGEGPIPA